MRRAISIVALAMLLGSCAAATDAPVLAAAAATPAPTGFLVGGYLSREALPDSLALLPPPPQADSAAQARDEAMSVRTLALRGSNRWEEAISDADLMSPHAIGNAMTCAAALPLTDETTPATLGLLRRMARDLALATSAAKAHYRRARPFMTNGQPTCTPDWESRLRLDGSYPSGHSAIGYGWGLILAELIPARATELVARGRSFGESRVVCNVHWLSDVEEGRTIAAAVVARLHADAGFQRDLAAARSELANPAHIARSSLRCLEPTPAL